MRRTARAGFTLVEMVVVLAILGIVAGVTVPALRDRRAADPLMQGASEAVTMLARSRQTAVERATTIRVSLDPVTRRFRLRALGSRAVSDSVAADSLPLPAGVTIDDAGGRRTITFAPTGEARGDTITLRWQGRVATVAADQWTGDAHVATH
jgi:general secretion pathway protein H